MNRMTRREALEMLLTGSVAAALMDFTNREEVIAEKRNRVGSGVGSSTRLSRSKPSEAASL